MVYREISNVKQAVAKICVMEQALKQTEQITEGLDSIYADYAFWLRQSEWTQEQARWLLIGLDPRIGQFERAALPRKLNQETSTYDHRFGNHKKLLENYKTYVFDFCFSQEGVTIGEARAFQNIKPFELLQWCFDHHIHWHQGVQDYLNKSQAEPFRFSEDSNIINSIKRLSLEDSWALYDAVLLVLGYDPQMAIVQLRERYYLGTSDRLNALEDATSMVETALNSWRAGKFSLLNHAEIEENPDWFVLNASFKDQPYVPPQEFIEWAISKGYTPPAQLLENMDMANAPAPSDLNYSTPYMDLMFRAIQELEITSDHQPVKKVIEHWFEQQYINGQKLSQRDIQSLASFVRMPGTRKGGTRKPSS